VRGLEKQTSYTHTCHIAQPSRYVYHLFPNIAVLGTLSSSYSRLLANERRRWSLLRATFILRREHSWLGSCLKYRQLNLFSQDHGFRYAYLRTSRTAAYLGFPLAATKEVAASKHRHVSAYFLTTVMYRPSPKPCVLPLERALSIPDEDVSLIDEKIAQLNITLTQNVRKRDAAQRSTQQWLRHLIEEQRTLATKRTGDTPTQDALRDTPTQDALRDTLTRDALRGTPTQNALRDTSTQHRIGGASTQDALSPEDDTSSPQGSRQRGKQQRKRAGSGGEISSEPQDAQIQVGEESYPQLAYRAPLVAERGDTKEQGTSDGNSSLCLPKAPLQSCRGEEGLLRSQDYKESSGLISSHSIHRLAMPSTDDTASSRGRCLCSNATPASSGGGYACSTSCSPCLGSSEARCLGASRVEYTSQLARATLENPSNGTSSSFHTGGCASARCSWTALSDKPDQMTPHLLSSSGPLRASLGGDERQLSSLVPNFSFPASTQRNDLSTQDSISEELTQAEEDYARALKAARAVANSMQIDAGPPLSPISSSHSWTLFDREAIYSPPHDGDLRV
jgi:hypothetical protein